MDSRLARSVSVKWGFTHNLFPLPRWEREQVPLKSSVKVVGRRSPVLVPQAFDVVPRLPSQDTLDFLVVELAVG